MKLLLRKDIPKVGLTGDVVEVTEGYARNYLLPQHLAMEPTAGNMKAIEEDKKKAAEERRLRRIALEEKASKMQEVEVTISAACNEEGHLYGSVGPREIAAALRDQGHDIDTKQVHLHQPIRQLDSVSVPVVFAEDLKVDVKVWVVRESASGELEEEKEEKQEERPRREADPYAYGAGIDAIETDY